MKMVSIRETDFFDRLYHHLRRNRFFLLYGVLTILCLYGCELVLSPAGVDDEIFTGTPRHSAEWITQGRFTAWLLLQPFFRNPFLPYFSLFLNLLAGVFAVDLIFNAEDRASGVLKYLLLPVFLGSPILYHSFTFICYASVVGLGFLFSAASVYFLYRKGIAEKVLSLVFGIAAIGCMQAMFLFLTSLLLFRLLEMNRKEDTTFPALFREGCKCVCFCAGVFAGYELILHLLLKILNQNMSEYITSQISFIPGSAGAFLQNLKAVFRHIAGTFLGSPSFYTMIFWTIPLFTAVCIGILFILSPVRSIREHRFRLPRFLLEILLFAVLFLQPFFFVFLSLNHARIELRTLISFPLLLTLLLYFAWMECGKTGRRILVIVTGLMILQSWSSISSMSYINYKTSQADLYVMNRIRTELLEQSGKTERPIPLLITGSFQAKQDFGAYPSGRAFQLVGVSVFSWDGTVCYRIIRLMKNNLIFDFREACFADYAKVEKEWKKMPCYPAKGSILMIHGVGVVKFGDMTDRQLKSLRRFPERKIR